MSEIIHIGNCFNSEQKCKICGRAYKEIPLPDIPALNKFNKKIKVPDCTCEAEAEAKAKEKKQQENKASFLSDKFANSLITPKFQQVRFSSKNTLSNYNKKECLKFAMSFDNKKQQGIYLVGDIGRGKTHLLACICNHLIESGRNCLFIKMSTLLDEFMETCRLDYHITTKELLGWLRSFDFIAIDDLGREKYSEKRLEFTHRIIDELVCYQKSVGITANPGCIEKIRSENKELDAAFDRLKELCQTILKFEGQSFRGNFGYND